MPDQTPAPTRRPVVPPRTMRRLPKDEDGRLIPWSTPIVDGRPAWGVIRRDRVDVAVAAHLCWVCGQRFDSPLRAFLLSPMTAITRLASEPPSHRVCVEYAARVCPFMLGARAGVAVVWTADRRDVEQFDGDAGYLFRVGERARSVGWWAAGEPATREQVRVALAIGFGMLAKQAGDSGAGPETERHLVNRLTSLGIWLPAFPKDGS